LIYSHFACFTIIWSSSWWLKICNIVISRIDEAVLWSVFGSLEFVIGFSLLRLYFGFFFFLLATFFNWSLDASIIIFKLFVNEIGFIKSIFVIFSQMLELAQILFKIIWSCCFWLRTWSSRWINMINDRAIEVNTFINIDYILILYISEHAFNIIVHFLTFKILTFLWISLQKWRLVIAIHFIVHILLLPYEIQSFG